MDNRKPSVYQIIVNCPHCEIPIQIMSNEINCAIFRHGAFKNNGKQMHPHTSKDLCDKYASEGLIYGCGKPFKLSVCNHNIIAAVCDYI